MKALTWDGRQGYVVNGAVRLTLAGPPDLGFAFDTVMYDDSNMVAAAKSVAGAPVALSANDTSGIAAFINGIAAQNVTALVWGVDASGALLGLVAPSAAYLITPPQPSPAASYRWDFTRRTWINLASAVDTGAAAIASISDQVSHVAAALAALPPIVPLSTATPKPESNTPTAGVIPASAPADHVHPRVSSATYVTLASTGLATATFTQAFDVQPNVVLTAINPSGRAVMLEVQSFIQTASKFTGCVIKGYRAQALPTLTAVLTNIVAALSGFDPLGASVTGVSVSVLAVKSSAPT